MADGPRYQRIADRLRAEIRAGRWKPGDRLPSHAELAEQMRVSLTTARNAVQVLVTENLVYTATSRGTRVRSQEVLESVVTDHIRPNRPRSSHDIFEEIARTAGREPSKEFSARMEPADPQVARWLEVPPDSWVVARTVVQYLDDEPWSWEVSFYPRDLAEATGIEQPSMAQLLTRMERDGLIRRTPNPRDARSQRIELTDKAAACSTAARRQLAELDKRAVAGFSAAEIRTLEELLTRLNDNLARGKTGSGAKTETTPPSDE